MFLSSPIRLQPSQGHTKNGEVKPSLLECCLRMVKLAGAKKNGNFVIIALLFFQTIFSAHVVFFWSWGDKRSVSKHKNKNPIRVFFSCFFQPLRDKAIFLFCFLTTALCFAFAAIMHLFKCQRFSHRRASGCINTRWSSTPHSTVVLCCLLSL